MRIAAAALLAMVIGCGGDDGNGNNAMTDGGGSGTVDAPPGIPADYTRLIGRSFSLAPGAKDIYRCVRVTIPTDTYITNIIAQAPTGTHHTVLSIAGGNNTTGPDGEQDCSVGTLGMQMLYASGVGTSPLDFPSGVGIKISAGQQIHLNLHLYNAGDEPLAGESAIWVKSQTTPPAQLAEMTFAGTFQVAIPSTGQPVTAMGGCTASDSYSLFAVWPHMHQIATHQKVDLITNSGTQVLHDQAYDFAEQTYFLQSPVVSVQAGDQVQVTCTYVNNTGTLVTWGDGSDKEMCFAGLYRYPAANQGLFQCTDNPSF